MKLSTPEEMESLEEPPESSDSSDGEPVVEFMGEEMLLSESFSALSARLDAYESTDRDLFERVEQLEQTVKKLQQENKKLRAELEATTEVVEVMAIDDDYVIAECDNCGGSGTFEKRNPFSGSKHVQCTRCGSVIAGEK